MSSAPVKYAYLFGPVPSRRLGRSLGVDLVPYKTCTLDCVFCQLGRTVDCTLTRREYVPVDAVNAELRTWAQSGETADYVTLSGSGEPTLHTRFGEVIGAARAEVSTPVALLTNGTLLFLPEVRKAAAGADVVKITVSAWDQPSFEAVNRPATGVSYAKVLDGMRIFRGEFSGELWVEVFFVPGLNCAPGEVRQIADRVGQLGADRIHLNTAVRPPAESFVRPLPAQELERFCEHFDPPAEVIADSGAAAGAGRVADSKTVIGMLARRPCTCEDIANSSGIHRNEVAKIVGQLLQAGRITPENRGGLVYYTLRRET